MFRVLNPTALRRRLPVPSEQYEDRCQRQAIRFVPFALFPKQRVVQVLGFRT